jgi:hypothetical protein
MLSLSSRGIEARMQRFGWLHRAGQICLGLIGLVLTLFGVVSYDASRLQKWAWVLILGLVAWVIALGWALLYERAGRMEAVTDDGAVDPRDEARRLLTAISARFDLATGRDWIEGPMIYQQETQMLAGEVFALLDRFYGPVIADEFFRSGYRSPATSPVSVVQQQASHLRGLLPELDSMPIMLDWNQHS